MRCTWSSRLGTSLGKLIPSLEELGELFPRLGKMTFLRGSVSMMPMLRNENRLKQRANDEGQHRHQNPAHRGISKRFLRSLLFLPFLELVPTQFYVLCTLSAKSK